jgi:hypothetical protein
MGEISSLGARGEVKNGPQGGALKKRFFGHTAKMRRIYKNECDSSYRLLSRW